jgi:5,10-methylenetetrahydromethanopterin reductase
MSGVLPRIGIRLSGAVTPQACIELAQAAEANGLASVWFAENPFQGGVFTTAGACAAATKRVRIGIGVVNPYTRHPVQTAMEFVALDRLAGGRAILGIGSGIAAPIRRMGIGNTRPVTAVREAVSILRALLPGNAITYRGSIFRLEDARLSLPRPDVPIYFGPRSGVSIYLAGAGLPMLRACGKIADGLIVSNLTPLRSTERMVAIVTEAAERAGRERPAIVQYIPCVARSNGMEARQTVKSAIAEVLTSFWPIGDRWPPAREAIVTESGIPRREFVAALDRLRRGEDVVSALDDRFVEAFAIAGTAEECLAQAARYRVAGVDELALTIAGPQPLMDISYLGRALVSS